MIPSLTGNNLLLSCGLIASILYLITDLLAGRLTRGYSFSVDSMSDLGASGATTRPLVLVLTFVACIFMVAFGVGLWRIADQSNWGKIVSILLLVHAISGFVSTLFFPNRLGVRPEFGTPGVLLMFLSVLCFVFAMIFGALAFQGWMRVISIAIPALYIILALIRFASAAISKGSAVVLIGVQERSMAYSFLAWVFCLALFLFQSRH